MRKTIYAVLPAHYLLTAMRGIQLERMGKSMGAARTARLKVGKEGQTIGVNPKARQIHLQG